MTETPNPNIVDTDSLTGEMHPIRRVVVALGSNLGERMATLQGAVEALADGKRGDPANPGLKLWEPHQGMTAVKRGNLLTVDGELLTRPGPRTVQGADRLCAALDGVRARRPG